jgi:hypothetical protein
MRHDSAFPRFAIMNKYAAGSVWHPSAVGAGTAGCAHIAAALCSREIEFSRPAIVQIGVICVLSREAARLADTILCTSEPLLSRDMAVIECNDERPSGVQTQRS